MQGCYKRRTPGRLRPHPDSPDERQGETTITSGADGTFAIDDLKPGKYTLSPTKAGFNGSEIRLEVAPAESAHVELALEPSANTTESAILREFAAMEKRIETLETELRQMKGQVPATAAVAPARPKAPLVASASPVAAAAPPAVATTRAKSAIDDLPQQSQRRPQQPGGRSGPVANPPPPVAPPDHRLPDALQAPEARLASTHLHLLLMATSLG